MGGVAAVPSVRSRRMGHYQIVDLRVRIANSLASVTAAQQLSDEVRRAVMREVQVSGCRHRTASFLNGQIGVERGARVDLMRVRRW